MGLSECRLLLLVAPLLAARFRLAFALGHLGAAEVVVEARGWLGRRQGGWSSLMAGED